MTDTYLPTEHFGAVESRILRSSPTLASHFLSAEEIESSVELRLCASAVDSCIRNLTHRFPDGPTYYVIVDVSALNAMIAKYDGFHCIVVSRAFYAVCSVISEKLFSWAPLLDFIDDGTDVAEPSSEIVKSREEALRDVISTEEKPAMERSGSSLTFCFFMMYFLTAHEIAHLALGHLSNEEMTDGHIDEIEGVIPNSQRRAVEVDADIFAGAATVFHTVAVQEHDIIWGRYFRNTHAGLRFFLVMAYMLFSAMDFMAPSSRPAASRTHPAPMMRIGLMNAMVAQVIETWGVCSASEALDVCRKAIRAAEIALYHTAGGCMEPEQAGRLQDQLDEEFNHLMPLLIQIIPRLDRSRLAGLNWGWVLGYRPEQAADG